MFFSTFSKPAAGRLEEQAHDSTSDVDNPAQSVGNRQSPVVDPIAHRPPGRFGHRRYAPSDLPTPDTPIAHPFRPPSQSGPTPQSPVISPSPHAYSTPIPTPDSPSHPISVLNPGDGMRDRWGNYVTYNYSLGSGPLVSPAEHARWVQAERDRRLNAHASPSASRTPQILVTPDSHQSSEDKPYNPPSSSALHPPSTSDFSRFSTSPSLPAQNYQWKDGHHDTCPYSICNSRCIHQGLSGQSGSPSQDVTSMRTGRSVPTARLPKLQTSSLEFRSKAPPSPISSQSAANSWLASSASSPLLSPPELRAGRSRLPLSPRSQPSPHSSTSSSLASSSPSTSPVTFVTFNPVEGAPGSHVITEDKSLTDQELERFFPLSAQGPLEVTSKKGTPCRKWTCQFPGCCRAIRRQDRISHVLEHQGKKRYMCNCGASFARSQDKKRHLREQAICRNCDRSVGRNGWQGICLSCSRDQHERDPDFSSVSEGSG